MPQGLQVWDENGNVVMDLTDRLSKFVRSGSVVVPSGFYSEPPYSIFIPHAGMSSNGDWAVFVTSTRRESGCILGTDGFTLWAFSESSRLPNNVINYSVYRN